MRAQPWRARPFACIRERPYQTQVPVQKGPAFPNQARYTAAIGSVPQHSAMGRWWPLMRSTERGDDTSRGKPHPDLFHQVLKKLGVTEPERVLALGDTPYDTLAAKPGVEGGRCADRRVLVRGT